MPSIYDAIRKDHDRHRALLEQIDGTSGDSPERREAWDTFYNDVKSHAAAEEETFYAKLMERTWGQDAARHSVQEHAEMDELMEELRDTEMDSPAWLTRFRKLKHEYEHHMEEEEEEIFTRARKVIDSAHNDEYGERFLSRKKKEMGLVEKKREDHLED